MLKKLSIVSTFVLGVLCVALVLNADPIKKRTEVTFNVPVEIPGMVLPPGTYVIKVPDPVTHADMVGFYNRNDSYLYKLVRTVPRYRLNLTDKTVITFEERAKGAPDAIKVWFYPGDYWGREFVYGKAKAVTVAEAAPAPAPPAPAPAPLEVTLAPAPEPAPQPIAEAPAAPVEIAEASAPAAAPLAPIQELPKTASPLPLIAMLGMSSLALAGFLRWIPKRAN